MKQCLCFVLFIWTLHVSSEYINYSDDRPTFDELFQTGRTAYDNDNHLEAVSHFEKAIADYRHEAEVKGQCWMRCHESIKPTQQIYSQLIDGQLNFLHFVIKTRSCYQLCKEKFLGRRSRIAKYIREQFENKEPYSFLQYSLFKVIYFVITKFHFILIFSHHPCLVHNFIQLFDKNCYKDHMILFSMLDKH